MQSDSQPSAPGQKKRTTQKRGNPEQLAADRALYEQLMNDDFVGRRMEQLREELWIYGWKILRAWMKNGTLIEKCGAREIPVSAHYNEVETLKRRGDLRDEIAHDAVEAAVATFTQELLPAGRWDPDKGAAMRTYFTVTCMLAFRETFKKWARHHRKHLEMTSYGLFDDQQLGRGLPIEDAAIFRWTIRNIMEGASLEARAICGLIYERKMNQKEIAEELGMTSRAVEGHMRRLRLHALLLGSRGQIEILYSRIGASKAGAR